ncbi:hypothetical protein AO721_08135 [Aeromonas veronii]|nr:hypothetical protein AO728_13660 [Aeromonas veronii]KRV77672.1 hypothetical protein AO719_14965 [Aeromonas veronii]KRV84629.1 hypothetical protein AO721_08135 [Aeromonas veronii]KRV84911.1 hypothetical protein AO739_07330 [Aeromonas veronii]
MRAIGGSLIVSDKWLRDRQGKSLIQIKAQADTFHCTEIYRLAVAQTSHRDSETAENAFCGQAGYTNKLFDTVGCSKRIGFPKEHAGQLADTIGHARSAGRIDSQTGEFPDLGSAGRVFTGKGGGKNAGQHIGAGATEQTDTGADSLFIFDQYPMGVWRVKAVAFQTVVRLDVPA